MKVDAIDKMFAWVLTISGPVVALGIIVSLIQGARRDGRKQLTSVEAAICLLAVMVTVLTLTIALIIYDHGGVTR